MTGSKVYIRFLGHFMPFDPMGLVSWVVQFIIFRLLSEPQRTFSRHSMTHAMRILIWATNSSPIGVLIRAGTGLTIAQSRLGLMLRSQVHVRGSPLKTLMWRSGVVTSPMSS